jgi:hypothetical protein
MLKICLQIARSLVVPLAVAFPLLALNGCNDNDVVATDSASLAGTYSGSATSRVGAVSYRLTIPETDTNSFPVTGTIVEAGETLEVQGTGAYDHPRVTFELVRAGGGVEDVFGLSGSVSSSHDAVTVSRAGATLTLSRD